MSPIFPSFLLLLSFPILFLLLGSTSLSFPSLPIVSSSSSSPFFDPSYPIRLHDSSSLLSSLSLLSSSPSSLPLFVMFFSPKSGKSKQVREEWQKMSKLTNGIVSVGAIDCLEYSAQCENHEVYVEESIPVLMLWRGNNPKSPLKYALSGAFDAKSLANFAYKNGLSDKFITQINTKTAIEKQKTNKFPRLLLFTNKPDTSPLYKGLSMAYNKKITFGEIKEKEKKILELYGIKEVKSPILILENPLSAGGDKSNSIIYSGEMTHKDIQNWLDEQLKRFPNSNESDENTNENKDGDGDDNGDDIIPDPFTSGHLIDLSDQSCLHVHCTLSGKICGILVMSTSSSSYKSSLDIYHKMSVLRMSDHSAISFTTLLLRGDDDDMKKIEWLDNVFHVTPSDYPQLLVFSAKKLRYQQFVGSYSVEGMSEFVEGILKQRITTTPIDGGERWNNTLGRESEKCKLEKKEEKKSSSSSGSSSSSSPPIDQGSVFPLDDKSYLPMFQASPSPWIILIGNSSSPSHITTLNTAIQVAAKLKNMIKFGWIDYSKKDNHGKVMEELGLQTTQEERENQKSFQVKYLRHGEAKEGNYSLEDYYTSSPSSSSSPADDNEKKDKDENSKKMSPASLHNFAVSLIESLRPQIIPVKGDQGFQSFLTYDQNRIHDSRVLLITNHTTPSLLLKTLAVDFPTFVFGISHESDKTITSKFSADKFPSIYLLSLTPQGVTETGQPKLGLQATLYAGHYTYGELSQFLVQAREQKTGSPIPPNQSKAAYEEEQRRQEERVKAKEKEKEKEKKTKEEL